MEGGPLFPRGGSGRAAPGTQGTEVGSAVGVSAGSCGNMPASSRWVSTSGSLGSCPMDEEGRAALGVGQAPLYSIQSAHCRAPRGRNPGI